MTDPECHEYVKRSNEIQVNKTLKKTTEEPIITTYFQSPSTTLSNNSWDIQEEMGLHKTDLR